MTYDSIPIIQSTLCIQRGPQFRFPRSKKKRIRNKWAKRDENYRWTPTAYRMGDTFIAHPSWVARLRAEMVDNIQKEIERPITAAFTSAAKSVVPAPGNLTLEKLMEATVQARMARVRYELLCDNLFNPTKLNTPYMPS